LVFGATPVPPPDLGLTQVVLDTAAAMRNISTLQVNMEQTKALVSLAEKVQAKGTLCFARPRRLAMDLNGPGGTQLVIDGDLLTMTYKALKKTETTNLTRDPRGRAIAEHLFLLLEAEPQQLTQIYGLTVVKEQPLRVELTPKSEALSRIIKRVEARFHNKGFVEHLVLEEQNGDSTVWEFSSPRLNQPLDPATCPFTNL